MANRALVDALSVAAPAAAIAFTGTTTAASTTVSALSSTNGLAAGQEITGVGIIAGTTIVSVNVGASTLVLSQTASLGVSAQSLNAYPAGPKGVVPASAARLLSRDVLGTEGWGGRSPNNWLYKFDDPRRLRRFRAAKAAIQSGRPMKDFNAPNVGRNILTFGDLDGGNDPNIGHWTIATWYATAKILNNKLYNNSVSYNTYALIGSTDPRMVGPGWEQANNFPGLPGVYGNYTDGSDLTLTLVEPWSGLDFYYHGNTGSFTYSVDGGAPVTVNLINNGLLNRVTITAPLGAHVIKFNRVSGVVRLMLWVGYDTAKPQLRFVDLSSSGSTVAQLVSNSLAQPAALKTLFDPALVILHYGYEIVNQRQSPPSGGSPGIPAATVVSNFVTNYSSIISAWKAQNVDVLLMSLHPCDDTNLYKDQASMADIRKAMYGIANTFDVPLIDNFNRWGSWTEAVDAGFLQHYGRPLPAGGWDLGEAAALALSIA